MLQSNLNPLFSPLPPAPLCSSCYFQGLRRRKGRNEEKREYLWTILSKEQISATLQFKFFLLDILLQVSLRQPRQIKRMASSNISIIQHRHYEIRDLYKWNLPDWNVYLAFLSTKCFEGRKKRFHSTLGERYLFCKIISEYY